MTDDFPDPYGRGLNVLRDVYAGDVVTLPEGTMAFNDVMVQTLGPGGYCYWGSSRPTDRSKPGRSKPAPHSGGVSSPQTSCERRSSCSLLMRDTRTSLASSFHARRSSARGSRMARQAGKTNPNRINRAWHWCRLKTLHRGDRVIGGSTLGASAIDLT